MALTCGAKFAKFMMFFINFVFWLAGGAMFGIGLWLLLDDNPFDFLEDSTIGNPMDDPLWSVAIYVIIAVGAFVFVLGFLGCCGACFQKQWMIFLYIVLVSVVLIAEIVGGILMIIFSGNINDSIMKEMKKGLIERYNGEDATDGDSSSWNNMQQQMKCCGAEDYNDYNTSAWHNKTKHIVPKTCCVQSIVTDNITMPLNYTLCELDAKNHKLDSSYLYTKGCYYGLKEWLDTHSIIIIGVAFGFVAVQIIGLIIACCLRSALKDAEKAEMV